ncbi:hypothetical protein [Methanosarcina mazei]|uniref:Uncharacterized protein n=1 Tax=Methanosarcina mazei TaxID=2209 RepID=A0A0F8F4K4_METMZ|nr:hypothetical protein [Methanosarcina mazei]KKG05364.1 hypothetical protein DU31_14575 [Methanosarcina mazei]KKG05575.1 hypothetical protein DU40_08800 [Methanosarcina mazei]KKG33809.1 hypothetical protein DU52_11465 [Methanosarcina mazei]KKG37219.1 hypothetical protein DU30_10505 [Methanosarcina mazei]KKG57409.1 hypothetical protein DU64_16970 [Methanosarcina mazei]
MSSGQDIQECYLTDFLPVFADLLKTDIQAKNAINKKQVYDRLIFLANTEKQEIYILLETRYI